MSEPALTSVLHYLRCLAETSDDRRQSDRQLLERFQHQHDESAFTVLMRRHGRLVLSAIRRVLTEEADVEDAFQATFLVLLRKAPSVRWQASMGSWLFGVAHRIALKARANALRRQRRELEASRERQRTEEPADLSWREALGLLHEELDRLPDKYRLPLLLCYLDGKSREEAAKALGCTVNAVKWRLERGRELLRTRLIRRGVTLSAALLAALVDAPAVRSVAPALVQATLNAAKTGTYRSSVVALMKAAIPALWIGKARLAVGVLLMVSLLAVGGGSSVAPPSAAPEPPAAVPSERRQPPTAPAQAKTKDTIIIRGRVLDPDGKPLAGSHVAVLAGIRRLQSHGGLSMEHKLLGQGETDQGGRFRVTVPRTSSVRNWEVAVVAAHAGYGLNCHSFDADADQLTISVRLHPEQILRGRFIRVVA